MPESMLDFLGIPAGDDRGPFSERYRVELLLKEGPRVTDEMVERARGALDDALEHSLPDADGEDYRIARAVLVAALAREEPS